MALYGGIDLHANNSVIVIIDDQDHVVHVTTHGSPESASSQRPAPEHEKAKFAQ